MAFKMSSVCFAEAVALGFFPDAPSADFCSRMERVQAGVEAWMETRVESAEGKGHGGVRRFRG
jgi:hypothetical protein